MDDRYRKAAGSEAEDTALAHLYRNGLRLVTRNYRCRLGEIDLVMLDGSTLVLIEVRYRSGSVFGGAAASVTSRKQRRLIRAAKHFRGTRADLRQLPARFDVVALDGLRANPQICWIRNAFTVDDQ